MYGVIPVPNDLEEANSTLSSHVETGVLNSHSLLMLEQMIAQVRKHSGQNLYVSKNDYHVCFDIYTFETK